jgi:hypothetical protein
MAEAESNLFILDSQNVEEEWKIIPGFSNYEASALGRIRRRTRCKSSEAGRVLKPAKARYLRVSLVRNGKAINENIHRLVAITFLGAPPTGKPQVNHKNGVKYDNRVENLEWVSAKENKQHSIIVLGQHQRGEQSAQAKFDITAVRAIHNAMMDATPPSEIIEQFGISETQLYRLKNRICWKEELADLPTNYPPPRLLIKGARVGTSKLTEEQVRAIKQMIAAGSTNQEIAAAFGLKSSSTIQWIRSGQSWKHVQLE